MSLFNLESHRSIFPELIFYYSEEAEEDPPELYDLYREGGLMKVMKLEGKRLYHKTGGIKVLR